MMAMTIIIIIINNYDGDDDNNNNNNEYNNNMSSLMALIGSRLSTIFCVEKIILKTSYLTLHCCLSWAFTLVKHPPNCRQYAQTS
jgi:hypothetical protein